jgi:hypothetical protein
LQSRVSGSGARKPNEIGQNTGLGGKKSRTKSRSASAVPVLTDTTERPQVYFIQIGKFIKIGFAPSKAIPVAIPTIRKEEPRRRSLADKRRGSIFPTTASKHGSYPAPEPTERDVPLWLYDALATAASVVEFSRRDPRQ